MRKSAGLALFSLVGLIFGLLVVPSAIATQSNCRPATDIQAAFAPNDCVFAYPDGGLPGDLDICHNLSGISGLGDITNPGRDSLLDASVVGVTPTGIIQTPKSLILKADVASDCRRWAAYRLDGELVSTSGDKYPITFTTGVFNKFDPTYDTSDYCFLVFTGGCGWTSYTGTVTLPANAASGSYAVLIHATSAGVAFGAGLPLADQNYLFSNILVVSSASGNSVSSQTPTPTPTTTSSPLAPADPQAPPTEVPSFTVSLSYQTFLLSLPTGIFQPYENSNQITSYAIRTIGPNGIIKNFDHISVAPGQFHAQVTWAATDFAPGSWAIELAGINNAGQGAWSIPHTITVPTPTPTITSTKASKSTISCIKGKLIKKVTGTYPTCPLGYKKKS